MERKAQKITMLQLIRTRVYINLCMRNIDLGEYAIEAANDFKYLGSDIATSHKDLMYRRAMDWNCLWCLKVWKSSSITLSLKRKLCDSLILSLLLYGCETWTLTRRREESINSFATSCYRIILNNRRFDRATNQTVLQQMNRSPLVQAVRIRQLRTLGHRNRATQLPISRYALYTPERGRNTRARPRLNLRHPQLPPQHRCHHRNPIGDLLEITVEWEDWYDAWSMRMTHMRSTELHFCVP